MSVDRYLGNGIRDKWRNQNGETRLKGKMAGQVRSMVPRIHAEAHKFVIWLWKKGGGTE